jgi:AcrR family transcriptional regulator
MARWKPDAPGRLAQAAMELYVERGFENTTVAEIAERAGLTERTFFRHFADKREVLFAGSADLVHLVADGVADAPATATPMEAVSTALQEAGAMLQQRAAWPKQRQAVIDAHTELRERELIKLASLSAAVADALRRRGVKEPSASLTAEAGIAAFKVAFERWVQNPTKRNLPRLIRETIESLRAIVDGSVAPT